MRTKLRNDRRPLTILNSDTLPTPLQRSVPRKVALNGSGHAAALSAIALLLGSVSFGAYLAYESAESSGLAAELEAAGRSTSALVTRVQKPKGKDSRVRIYYRYSADGQHFESRMVAGREDPLASSVIEGSRLSVVYLPSRPDKSWVEGRRPKVLPVWAPLVPPAIGLPAALLIVALLLRQKRLLEEGRAAMARVISTQKEKHQDSWRVTYSWKLPSGATRQAHVSRSAEPAGAGSFIPVVYDRDRPERHSVYPLSLVRLR